MDGGNPAPVSMDEPLTTHQLVQFCVHPQVFATTPTTRSRAKMEDAGLEDLRLGPAMISSPAIPDGFPTCCLFPEALMSPLSLWSRAARRKPTVLGVP